MVYHLPTDSIIEFNRNGTTLSPSEHNRAPVSVNIEEISNTQRMANGRLRKYLVARKRSWSTSWTMIPSRSERTADGKAGGAEIEEFYRSTPGEFEMTIVHKNSDLNETVTVVFSDFSKSHERRGADDFWNIELTVEEC